MFTSPWMNPPDERRPADRRRAWILTSSVVLHGLALATLAGFETWRVAAVAEPPVAAVFEVQLPLPPLPAPPSPRKAPEAHPRQTAAPRPQSIAPATPAVPATPPLTQPDPKAQPSHEPAKPIDPALTDPTTPAAPGRDASGPGDPSGNGHDRRSGDWGPGSDDDRPLPVGGRIRPPQIVPGTKVQPRYTEQARQARLQGVVVLQATIDERGNVIDVHLLKTMRFGLDEEAVKAVSQWKFTPALLDGRPVKVYFDLTVQFEVR